MKKSPKKIHFSVKTILNNENGTIQLDVFLTFILGLLFSLVSPESDKNKPLLKRHSFRLSLLYLIVVGIGVAVGAYTINPAWMWMYWVDPSGIPISHMLVIFSFIYPGSFLLGYLLAPHLKSAGWEWRVLTIMVGIEAIFILATLPSRLWQVGSFDQFATGETIKLVSFSPLSFTPLCYELLIGLGLAVFGGIGLLIHLNRLPD